MKRYRWLLVGCLSFFVSGCSLATYIEKRVTEYHFHAEGESEIAVFVEGVAVDTKRTTAQDPESDSNIKAALSQKGGVATAAKDTVLDKIESVFRPEANITDSQNPQDSYNPITTTTTETTTTTTDIDAEQVKVEEEDEENDRKKFPLENVTWLHTDVSGWKQTGTLKSVSTTSNTIKLDYNKAKVWPAKKYNKDSPLVNANPWIFVKQDGIWYAATFEWLRPGHTTKDKKTVAGNHIKRDPLKNFKPKKGETYGFMVSGLARDKTRNTEERTNVVMFKWK